MVEELLRTISAVSSAIVWSSLGCVKGCSKHVSSVVAAAKYCSVTPCRFHPFSKHPKFMKTRGFLTRGSAISGRPQIGVCPLTILFKIITRMKLLFSNYLGGYSHSFQGSSELVLQLQFPCFSSRRHYRK